MRPGIQSLPALLAALCCLSFFLQCAKPKSHKQDTFVIIDDDTLSRDDIEALRPASVFGDSLCASAIAQIALAAAWQAESEDRKAADSAIADELKGQFFLRAGEQWSVSAAQSILAACRRLAVILDSCQSDSCVNGRIAGDIAAITISDTFSFASFTGLIPVDTSLSAKQKRLTHVTGALFGLSSKAASLIADFASSAGPQSDTLKSEEIARAVKNLIGNNNVEDSATGKKTKASMALQAPPDNSALALKFRNQQSILDSIQGHLPNLQALYRKQLKIDGAMQGVVYVTFRVAPSGAIESARVKSSEIDSEDFLTQLVDYAQKMHFKDIPERVGFMTFDFPFEFRPEG